MRSTTSTGRVPAACLSEPCCVGIDEAGRGPVLGHMVYGIAFAPLSKAEALANFGFADSKVLTEAQRDELFAQLQDESVNDVVGWSLRALSPQDISRWMQRRAKYNLNAISHDTAIELIRHIQALGVQVAEVYVDTVGPPESYEKKLSALFPGITFAVRKKADSLFPIVSAASICAKVTRDALLKNWVFEEEKPGQASFSREFGSGYPGDPNTIKWLENEIDPVFGYPGIIRFSWQTCERILQTKCVKVSWASDEVEETGSIKDFIKKDAAISNSAPWQRSAVWKSMQLQPVEDFD